MPSTEVPDDLVISMAELVAQCAWVGSSEQDHSLQGTHGLLQLL